MRTGSGGHINLIWNAGGPFIGDDGKPHGRVTVQDGTGNVLHTTSAVADNGGPYTSATVRALYNSYGFITDQQIMDAVQHPPPAETAQQRIDRNVMELNTHLRDLAGLETSIRELPGAVQPSTPGGGSYAERGLPLRWFQDAANSQTETELPNLKSIQITRGVGTDAGTCAITMYNQKMGATGEGQTGYYTSTRGDSIDGTARWGYTTNEWHNVLVPNTILRTYQGYGGCSKTINQARADGNIVLTGIWFIDSVQIRTDGMIEIHARDPMKLMLEQQLYSPLVPHKRYPLKYYRWQYFNEAIHAAANTVDGITYDPIFLGADAASTGVGYLTTDGANDIDAFGDARVAERSGGTDPNPHSAATSVRVNSGGGYYILNGAGQISCYGGAPFYGDPFSNGYVAANGSNGVCIDMAVTSGGYWVLDNFGHTFAFGGAPAYGSQRQIFTTGVNSYTSIDATPGGYRVLDQAGNVLCWPDRATVGWFGSRKITEWEPPLSPGTNNCICIRNTPTGGGYWILTTTGQVAAFGDAPAYGQIANPAYETDWKKKFWKLIPQVTDGPVPGGYLLMQGNGHINPFGGASSFGDPTPGGQSIKRTDGNYLDYTDIVRDLALWSGFLLYDSSTSPNAIPDVYGNLESTGAASPDALPDNIFDKRPVIEAIHQMKETVGYLAWCDDEGAFRFESPNWWAPGNFNEFGTHLNVIPEIDERVQLIDYSVSVDDAPLRSMVIISSEDPDQAGTTTVTTRIVPRDAQQLRGITKPAMWVNGWFQSREEQRIMAELIALHIHFEARLANATCAANPLISIDDQVRIIERQTNESYIHYVRGMQTTMDLDTGDYKMTLNTNWLGTRNGWGVAAPGSAMASWGFQMSQATAEWSRTQRKNPNRPLPVVT